jgi:hypothetical protein
MAKVLLGTDNGCTMSEAALFDLDGKKIAVAMMLMTKCNTEAGCEVLLRGR